MRATSRKRSGGLISCRRLMLWGLICLSFFVGSAHLPAPMYCCSGGALRVWVPGLAPRLGGGQFRMEGGTFQTSASMQVIPAHPCPVNSARGARCADRPGTRGCADPAGHVQGHCEGSDGRRPSVGILGCACVLLGFGGSGKREGFERHTLSATMSSKSMGSGESMLPTVCLGAAKWFPWAPHNQLACPPECVSTGLSSIPLTESGTSACFYFRLGTSRQDYRTFNPCRKPCDKPAMVETTKEIYLPVNAQVRLHPTAGRCVCRGPTAAALPTSWCNPL